MATRLYLIPQTFDSTGALVPKYTSTDLSGHSWVAMPFGIEGIVLVATDPNPALAAESDVFAFPQNLDSTLTPADVANVQSFFAAQNIPSGYVVAGVAWRDLVRMTAKVFQIVQRHHGITGAGLFTTNTDTSLLAQSTAIKNATAVPPAPIRAGIAPTLSGPVPSAVKTKLPAVAASFGFTAPDTSGTLEAALLAVGNQFNAPLRLSRGDGFTL